MRNEQRTRNEVHNAEVHCPHNCESSSRLVKLYQIRRRRVEAHDAMLYFLLLWDKEHSRTWAKRFVTNCPVRDP